MIENQSKLFQELSNQFSKKYEEYQDEFGDFIEDTDLRDQLKHLSDYVDELSQLSRKQISQTLQAGIAYANEKKKAYMSGEAEGVIFFEFLYKYPEKKVFHEAIQPKDFKGFWHKPGVPAAITKKAHDKWWNLMLFKHQIVKDYFYKKEVVYSFKELWNDVDERSKEKIETIARKLNNDGRSKYKFEEIKVYLTVYVTRPEISSAEKRRDYSLQFLSDEASKRLEKAGPNVYGTSWEKKFRAQN